MRVIVVHKVFIGMSMAVALILAITRLSRWSRTGDVGMLVLACFALLSIPVMGLYLKRIWNR